MNLVNKCTLELESLVHLFLRTIKMKQNESLLASSPEQCVELHMPTGSKVNVALSSRQLGTGGMLSKSKHDP